MSQIKGYEVICEHDPFTLLTKHSYGCRNANQSKVICSIARLAVNVLRFTA